jgi:hypothetical protein
MFDDETATYVEVISGCLHFANAALSELRIRARPN